MYEKHIEHLLTNPFGIYCNQPIALTKWQKNLLTEMELNNPKNIIIITDRKSGSTSFCKWLHYFKPKGKTFILSDNVDYSKHIKQLPIQLNPNVIGKVNSNYDWMEVISKRKFLKEGLNLELNPNLKEIGINSYFEFEFMVDNCYDVKLLNKILTYNSCNYFTLSISKPLDSDFWDEEKNKDFFEWLDKMKKRSDTLVFVNKSINYEQIRNAYLDKKFEVIRNEVYNIK